MHIAIERAVPYKKTARPTSLDGSNYDYHKGYWVTSSGLPLVLDPNGPKPTSKKNDIETGEDKKGE